MGRRSILGAIALFCLFLVACSTQGLPGFEYRWASESQWHSAPPPRPSGDDMLIVRTVIPELAVKLADFGVMAYELWNGAVPFPMPLVFLSASKAPLPRPPELDPAVKDPILRALLRACLSIDPNARPTAEEVALALEAGGRAYPFTPPAVRPLKSCRCAT